MDELEKLKQENARLHRLAVQLRDAVEWVADFPYAGGRAFRQVGPIATAIAAAEAANLPRPTAEPKTDWRD